MPPVNHSQLHPDVHGPWQEWSEDQTISFLDLSVFSNAPGDHVMVILKGHFDDSKSSVFTSVAGYVGTVNQWRRFETDWQVVLDRFGVHYFHMKEFTVSQGEFDGWDKQEKQKDRILLVQNLCRVIDKSGIEGVCAGVPHEHLEYFNTQARTNLKPFPLCVAMCLVELCNRFGWRFIECVFDRPAKVLDGGKELRRAGYYLARDRDFAHWWSRQYVDCKLLNPTLSAKDIAPLQAADMIAWESRESSEKSQGVSIKTDAQKQGSHWTGERGSLVALSAAAPCQGFIWTYDMLMSKLHDRLTSDWLRLIDPAMQRSWASVNVVRSESSPEDGQSQKAKA